MKILLAFELRSYFKKPWYYLLLLVLLGLGLVVGSGFSIGTGPDVFKNGPYLITYMIGFLSLFCIFFTCIFSAQILFREKDSNFNLVLYATPIKEIHYLSSRYVAVILLSACCFISMIAGFAIGQAMHGGKVMYTDFHLMYYVQPLFLFGIINTIFCASVIGAVGWLTKNKLLLYVTGLFIYIFYMVMLIYSRSPMIAHGMPQTAEAASLSALLDPFGMSAFFMETANWTIPQRNSQMVVVSGTLLINRAAALAGSAIAILTAFRFFSFSLAGNTGKKRLLEEKAPVQRSLNYQTVQPVFNWRTHWASFFSFTKIDLTYVTKSIPFVLTSIGLLFYNAMEIDGHINGGIRFPQRYASSGLMADRIIGGFHGMCLIIVLYYANEIVWRSRNSNFDKMENATAVSPAVLFFSKWFTLSMIILFFSGLMVLLGITFQLIYAYPHFDCEAYAGIFLFNSFPLIATAGIVLLVHKLVNHRFIGLIMSAAVVMFTATSFANKIFPYPVLRFQVAYSGAHSDMNAFGAYASHYAWRFLFGISIVFVLATILTRGRRWKLMSALSIGAAILLAVVAGLQVSRHFQPKEEYALLSEQADYEKKYRHMQSTPQPSITYVQTNIDLYPKDNSYKVAATYTIANLSNKPVDSVLINFPTEMLIEEASLLVKGKQVTIKDLQTGIIKLDQPLLPNDTASFFAKFSYRWFAVNGHHSFNAITDNGSFMRISRYYPTFGYQASNEIEDLEDRKAFLLGDASEPPGLNAPKDSTDESMRIDMTVSTDADQTAIGVGELVKEWKEDHRNFFQYRSNTAMAFRFAVSSAAYAVKKDVYRGKKIEVYYHPLHHENVDHLIHNIKYTLDYCDSNFSAYPFSTIRFAEVSSFTKGFAATAYPATIFMTEDMVFHTNIKADRQQDLINELAGHELAHLWWGTNQIFPDERAGAIMLTETLAMYTEMMLVKRMHGQKRLLENIHMHLGLYLDERGFATEHPLYLVSHDERHVGYSKGTLVMYQLSRLIGEEKLNLALKNFLSHHAHPQPEPLSTDLLKEIYAVSDTSLHQKLDDLFKKMTLYNAAIKTATVTTTAKGYTLSMEALVDKFYEDGKGKRTTALFNDAVEFSIEYKDGSTEILKVPAMNGKIKKEILLEKQPVSVEIDPMVELINIAKETKKVI